MLVGLRAMLRASPEMFREAHHTPARDASHDPAWPTSVETPPDRRLMDSSSGSRKSFKTNRLQEGVHYGRSNHQQFHTDRRGGSADLRPAGPARDARRRPASGGACSPS